MEEEPKIPWCSARFQINKHSRDFYVGPVTFLVIMFVLALLIFREGLVYPPIYISYKMFNYPILKNYMELHDLVIKYEAKEQLTDAEKKELDSAKKGLEFRDSMAPILTSLLYFIIFGPLVFIIHYLLFRKYMVLKYLPCPYKDCNKSMLVFSDWQCPYCNNFQGKERYITEECTSCGRELETAFCEHCQREFEI